MLSSPARCKIFNLCLVSLTCRQLVGVSGIICCTDDFFIVEGRYSFDPEKLSANHQKNQEKGETSIQPVYKAWLYKFYRPWQLYN